MPSDQHTARTTHEDKPNGELLEAIESVDQGQTARIDYGDGVVTSKLELVEATFGGTVGKSSNITIDGKYLFENGSSLDYAADDFGVVATFTTSDGSEHAITDPDAIKVVGNA